jgi:hypothetical protein
VGEFLTLVFTYSVTWVSRGGGRSSGVTWAMVREIFVGVGELGGGAHEFLSWWSKNFFNRSPITLKFGPEKKIERERVKKRRARARVRERASCCIYFSQVVVVLLVS